MIQPLDNILQYESKDVLHRFGTMYPDIPKEEAQVIFKDMLRYLWLSAILEEQRKTDPETPDVTITQSMMIIDEMWHAFVLYTRSYEKFCHKNFGEIIHHPPLLPKLTRNISQLGETKSYDILVEELIAVVYEQLGGEVAIRWFDTYLQKYANENWLH